MYIDASTIVMETIKLVPATEYVPNELICKKLKKRREFSLLFFIYLYL